MKALCPCSKYNSHSKLHKKHKHIRRKYRTKHSLNVPFYSAKTDIDSNIDVEETKVYSNKTQWTILLFSLFLGVTILWILACVTLIICFIWIIRYIVRFTLKDVNNTENLPLDPV
eukprot:136834_1